MSNATRRVMLFAVLCLGLTVAACGGDEEEGAAVPSGKVKGNLTIWASGVEGEKLGALGKQFQAENPGLTVKVTPIAQDAAHDKYLTSIAGAKTPDVGHIGTTWNAEFAKAGALEEVPSSIDEGKFFPSAQSTTEVDGKRVGVPWYVETRALYYRTDIAKKAGVTEPPKDWDELKAMAKAMKEKGGGKYGIGLSTNNWQEWLPFVWQAGGEVFQDGKFTFNTPEATEATAFYKSFFDEGLAPSTTPAGFDITPAFVRGTHPMFFSGPWHMGLIEEAGGKKLEGKWDVAKMPVEDSGTSFVGGGNLVVFKQSKNKDAAWKFVEWMSQPAQQAKFYEEAAALPAVQDAWEEPALKQDDNVALFGEQLQDGKAPPAVPKWDEVGETLNTELEKAFSGNTPPEQSTQSIQQKAESIGTS